MALPIAGILQSLVGPVLNPLLERIPNPNERAKAKEQMERSMLTAFTAAMNAQNEINKAQAEHPSIWVAGARPFIMWGCGFGVVWQFIIYPLLMWLSFLFGVDIGEAPRLDAAELMALLTGMLGMGGMRSFEKRHGVARSSWSKEDE